LLSANCPKKQPPPFQLGTRSNGKMRLKASEQSDYGQYLLQMRQTFPRIAAPSEVRVLLATTTRLFNRILRGVNLDLLGCSNCKINIELVGESN
jgi:hypothetical protein